MENDGQRQEFLENFSGSCGAQIQERQEAEDAHQLIPKPPAVKVPQNQDRRDDSLDDQCGVRRGVAGMNLAEPRGHVGIEAGDERNAGGTAHPRGTYAGNGKAKHEGKGDGDPAEADTAGHVTDGLNYTLQHVDIFSHGDEQGKSGAHVERAGKDSAQSDSTGEGAAGVLDFVAHDRREFEANQAEADDAERIQDETRVCGDFEIYRSDGGAKARPDHYAQTDQDGGGDERSDGAEIVNPLADSEADDVEHSEESQQD